MPIGPSGACHVTPQPRSLKLLVVPSNSRLLQKVEELLYEPDVNISIDYFSPPLQDLRFAFPSFRLIGPPVNLPLGRKRGCNASVEAKKPRALNETLLTNC